MSWSLSRCGRGENICVLKVKDCVTSHICSQMDKNSYSMGYTFYTSLIMALRVAINNQKETVSHEWFYDFCVVQPWILGHLCMCV